MILKTSAIILFSTLSLFANDLQAQNPSVKIDTSTVHTNGMKGFEVHDPVDDQVQKRWRPANADTSSWYNHISLGVSSGVDFRTNWHSTTSQIPIQVFLGYNFTPVHQVRLQGGIEKIQIENSPLKNKVFTGELQYLANISNFISGTKNDSTRNGRMLDISTLIGVGGQYYNANFTRRLSPFARIGFDASMHIGPNVSLFVQPYAGLTLDQDIIFKSTDPSSFNIIYGINAGLAAHLNSDKKYYSSLPTNYQNIFFEASTGWGANLKGFNATQSGNNEYIGIGRWFAPSLGLRIGVMGQQNYWQSKSDTGSSDYLANKHHVALAGRAELLVNLLNLGKSSKSFATSAEGRKNNTDWELDLSVGGLYGYNAKNGVEYTNGTWRCYYYGMTAALQTLYRVSPGSYIFIEPRFFNNYYQIPYVDNLAAHKREIDRFFTFNVGARVYASKGKERYSNDTTFTKNTWVGLGMGGFKMFEATRIKQSGFGAFQPSASLSLGYDAHRLASVRFQFDWQRLARVTGTKNNTYQMLDMRLLYMLPFTNLIRGVQKDNRFHTYIELGPTESIVVGQNSESNQGVLSNSKATKDFVGKSSLGAAAGMLMAYDIGGKKMWDIYAEVLGQYNFKQGITPELAHKYNNLKWGLYGGVRYHFNQQNDENMLKDAYIPEYMRGWFVEGSTGWTFPLKGSTEDGRQEGNALHRSGALFNLNVGHWITRYLGARVGLQAQQHSIATDEVVVGNTPYTAYTASATGSMTMELLTTPLNYFRMQEDRNFDLNLSAGFQLGEIAMGNHNNGARRRPTLGFTSSAQAMCRLMPGVWGYIEPRYSTFHYHTNGELTTIVPRGTFRNLAISVGARLYRADKEDRSLSLEGQGDSNTFQDELTKHWWIGLQVGGGRNLNTYKYVGDGHCVAFQPSLSLNAGYDLHRLATLRGQLEYTNLGSYNAGSSTVERASMYNLRLIYMLNMTNLWRGTNWPRLSVFPEFGVAYSHHNSDKTASVYQNGEPRQNAFGVLLGAMAAWRMTPSVDLTVETQEQYHFPHGYMPYQSHSRVGNGYWNLTAGVRYHIKDDLLDGVNWKMYTPAQMQGWFIEGGYGLTTIPLYTGNSAGHMMGDSWRVSFGRWFSSICGVRAGITGSQTYWSENKAAAQHEAFSGEQIHGAYTIKSANQQVGGRIEFMVNPLNLSSFRRHHSENALFDLNLAMGLDFGVQYKAHVHNAHHYWTHGYVGFTSSAQALYRIADGVQLFVEPRYMTASYKSPNDLMLTAEHTTDRFFDLSIGARLYRPTSDARKQNKGIEADTEQKLQGAFRQNLWLGLDLGGIRQMGCQRGYTNGIGIQPTVGIEVGYDLHPMATFGLQANYRSFSFFEENHEYSVVTSVGAKKHYNGNFNRCVGDLNIRAMYMLNLTNLWQSTRHQPRLSAYWTFGPALSQILSDNTKLIDGEMAGGSNPTITGQKFKGSSFGIFTGVDVAIRVAPKWDVALKSIWQYNFKTPYLPHVHHMRPYNCTMEFGLGTRYHF